MLRPKLNLVIQDPASGRARPGAWVSVYTANTFAFAPLFADDDVTHVGNPIQANNLGQVAFRVPVGVYDVSATWDGSAPSIIEDVVAWTPGVVPENPGEIVVGGEDGAIILPAGTVGQVLTVLTNDPDSIGWTTLSPGHGLPTGPKGAILAYPEVDVIAPLLPGAQDQVLVMSSGLPTWGTALDLGVVIPINQPGDLVAGDASGLPARLPRGATDQVLTVLSSGLVGWGTGGLGSIITTEGDLIVGGPGGVPQRLPKGIPNATLHVDSAGVVAWTVPPAEPIRLYMDTVLVGNPANTAENVLKSFMVPANTLDSANDRLRITGIGNFGGKSGGKTIRVYFGSLLCLTFGTSLNHLSFKFEVEVLREALAQERSHGVANIGDTLPTMQDVTGTQDLSVAVNVRVTAQIASPVANIGNLSSLEIWLFPA
jgi:hypothetical protein